VGLFYNAPEPTRGACRGTGVRGRCDLLSEFFGYLLPARRWSCSPAIIWTCCAWFVDVTTTRPCRSLPSCVLRLDTLLANWRGSTSPTTSTAVPYRHFLTTNTPPLVFATAVSYTVRRGTARRAVSVKTERNVTQMFVELHLISPATSE